MAGHRDITLQLRWRNSGAIVPVRFVWSTADSRYVPVGLPGLIIDRTAIVTGDLRWDRALANYWSVSWSPSRDTICDMVLKFGQGGKPDAFWGTCYPTQGMGKYDYLS